MGYYLANYTRFNNLLPSRPIDPANDHPVAPAATITDRVWFDINIHDKPSGRIELGLYGEVVPKTVSNFRCLCEGSRISRNSGLRLTFKGSGFHRIIPNFMIQGGDFTRHNGTGGYSIYGPNFPDENFKMRHNGPGVLSMANAGPHTNGSQFFICLRATPHLDGKHVVLGVVTDGWQTVRAIEAVGSMSGQPSATVTITDCGVLPPTPPPSQATT
eukprot:g28115.t1